MLGTVLALLVAFFVAGRDAISKIIVKEDDEFVVCWAMALYTFVFLLPFIFFGPLPSLGPGFFKALIVGAILNFLARLTFLKAIKHADLSIVSPLLSFSPVFIMLAAPVLFKETNSLYSIIGVGLMLAGSGVLTMKRGRAINMALFKSLLAERWLRLGMMVALIWSLVGIVDKAGIYNSSPLFWAVCVQGLMVGFGLPAVITRTRARGKKVFPSIRSALPIGLSNAVVIGLYVLALSLTQVSFVFSMYQTNILFSILFGWLIFKEENIKEKFQGAAIMLVGVIVMSLF